MDADTLTALEASIEHWRQNAEGPVEDATIGWAHCALCARFASRSTGNCCSCPVSLAVLKSGCGGTPYEAAWEAYSGRYAHPDIWRAAARAELNFLLSLLPPEAAP